MSDMDYTWIESGENWNAEYNKTYGDIRAFMLTKGPIIFQIEDIIYLSEASGSAEKWVRILTSDTGVVEGVDWEYFTPDPPDPAPDATYTTIDTLITAKAGPLVPVSFLVNEVVYILDTASWVKVLTAGPGNIQNVDWNYLTGYRELSLTDSKAIASIAAGTNLVRAKEDYIGPFDEYPTRNLHSAMRNSFYEAVLLALLDERRELADRAYLLKSLYDLSPSGYQEFFDTRYSNAVTILNGHNLPTFFKAYIGSASRRFNDSDQANINLDLKTKWMRDLLYSEYLARRYAGSYYAYRANFARLLHPGTIYLRMKYADTGLGSELVGKFYRAKDNANYTQILPQYQVGVWPNTPSNYTSKRQYTSYLDALLWDTNRSWDELGGEAMPQWDMLAEITSGGKGLLLEYNLDRLYYHDNIFGAPYCLLDEPWYKAMDALLVSSARAGDNIMLGAQISLVANARGSVSSYSDDPEGIGRDQFTHPNIKTRFQIYHDNWTSGNTGAQDISRIVLGDGGADYNTDDVNDILVEGVPETFWILEEELGDPVEAAKIALLPTGAIRPLLSTAVGVKEQKFLEGYKCINVTCHQIPVEAQELETPTLTVSGSPAPAGGISDFEVVIFSSIKFPLPPLVLTPGDVTFTIRGVNYTVSLLVGNTVEDIVISLNNDVNFALLWTATAAGTDLIITANTTENRVGNNTFTDTSETGVTSGPVSVAGRLEIDLPNVNLAPGTCKFDLRYTITTSGGVEETFVLRVEEMYNPFARNFNTVTTLWKEHETSDENDTGLRPVSPILLVDYTEDLGYSVDTNYFPNFVDGILDLNYRDPTGLAAGSGITHSAAQIDYENGKIKLYLRLHPDGRFGSDAYKSFVFLVTYSYKLNSYGAATVSNNTAQNLTALTIGINEVAIYNNEVNPKIIAYGVFPPVIYNPDLRHLSLNIALEREADEPLPS